MILADLYGPGHSGESNTSRLNNKNMHDGMAKYPEQLAELGEDD